MKCSIGAKASSRQRTPRDEDRDMRWNKMSKRKDRDPRELLKSQPQAGKLMKPRPTRRCVPGGGETAPKELVPFSQEKDRDSRVSFLRHLFFTTLLYCL